MRVAMNGGCVRAVCDCSFKKMKTALRAEHRSISSVSVSGPLLSLLGPCCPPAAATMPAVHCSELHCGSVPWRIRWLAALCVLAIAPAGTYSQNVVPPYTYPKSSNVVLWYQSAKLNATTGTGYLTLWNDTSVRRDGGAQLCPAAPSPWLCVCACVACRATISTL